MSWIVVVCLLIVMESVAGMPLLRMARPVGVAQPPMGSRRTRVSVAKAFPVVPVPSVDQLVKEEQRGTAGHESAAVQFLPQTSVSSPGTLELPSLEDFQAAFDPEDFDEESLLFDEEQQQQQQIEEEEQVHEQDRMGYAPRAVHKILPNNNWIKPFQVNCRDISDDLCNKAGLALFAIGRRFSRTFRLNHIIIVEVAAMAQPKPQDIVHTDAPLYVRGRFAEDSNASYTLYPLALARQFHGAAAIPSTGASYDIRISLNSNLEYWTELAAAASETESIPPNAYDLEYILAHEVLHGMGFGSTIHKNYGLLHPSIAKQYTQDTETLVWHPPAIFDLHLVVDNSSLAARMQQFTSQIDLASLKQKTTSSTGGGGGTSMLVFLKILALYLQQSWKMPKPVVFQTASGQAVELSGREDIHPFGHLADSYVGSLDFLMTSRIPIGKSLAQVTAEALATAGDNQKMPYDGCLGPLTIDILKTIGWETIDQWYIQRKFQVDPEEPFF